MSEIHHSPNMECFINDQDNPLAMNLNFCWSKLQPWRLFLDVKICRGRSLLLPHVVSVVCRGRSFPDGLSKLQTMASLPRCEDLPWKEFSPATTWT